MRSISMVEKLEVDYKGSLFQNAVCLVDVDNDGLDEFCIGFTNGELHVYKGIAVFLFYFTLFFDLVYDKFTIVLTQRRQKL